MQSDLNTLIEQSQYSSEEQCSKLIDKEIWLVMGSYCHCQQVVTFFFFFFGLHLTTWVKGPTLTLCPGPLNFSGRPCPYHQNQINKLEMIQHRAARFVLNQPWRRNVRDSISSLLSSLKWPTLQLQRESTCLILLYKIINNILQIPTNYLPTPSYQIKK